MENTVRMLQVVQMGEQVRKQEMVVSSVQANMEKQEMELKVCDGKLNPRF
jgi:hypothetical protein